MIWYKELTFIKITQRHKTVPYNITREEIVIQFGKSLATIKRIIAELKEKGLIERIGSDKTGYWKVK